MLEITKSTAEDMDLFKISNPHEVNTGGTNPSWEGFSFATVALARSTICVLLHAIVSSCMLQLQVSEQWHEYYQIGFLHAEHRTFIG
jgi:hypothetical protein